MTRAETRRPRVDDPDATRDEWLGRLHDLMTCIKRWAEGAGWRTRFIEKSMKDSVLGSYKAPAMLMQRDTVEVILDPVGRFAPGTEESSTCTSCLPTMISPASTSWTVRGGCIMRFAR